MSTEDNGVELTGAPVKTADNVLALLPQSRQLAEHLGGRGGRDRKPLRQLGSAHRALCVPQLVERLQVVLLGLGQLLSPLVDEVSGHDLGMPNIAARTRLEVV